MLILRLSRVGKKKQPTYRLVVQEKHRDPWGTSVEILGNYNPRTKALDIKEDRIKHWLNNGAQMSPTVNNLLIDKKVISGEKVRATTNDVKKEDGSAPAEGSEPVEEKEKGGEKKKEEKPAEAPAGPRFAGGYGGAGPRFAGGYRARGRTGGGAGKASGTVI